jgi:ATP/maltotriose-dependent transcriptional regulator MalT
MDGQLNETLLSNPDTARSKEWMHRVISLLEVAVGQLGNQAARGTLLEATLLLRRQIDPPSDAGPANAASTFRPLSRRETGVLELITLGMSNKRIAQSLGIAPETVKTHAKSIFAKLESRTRAQAVARAGTIGLL